MIFTGLKVGVLELQGDFAEHSSMMRRCGANVVPVRLPKVGKLSPIYFLSTV